MLNLVANKKTTKVTVYSDQTSKVVKIPNSINIVVSQEKINNIVKIAPTNIIAYDNVYTEPTIFIDGGLYNQDAGLVSAGFYNTTLWDETWSSKL